MRIEMRKAGILSRKRIGDELVSLLPLIASFYTQLLRNKFKDVLTFQSVAPIVLGNLLLLAM